MGRKERPYNPRVDAVMNFIVAYKTQHGISPSVREIMEGCNLPSTSITNYYIDKLIKMGKITHTPGTSRGIEVVGGKWVAP